ncbi:MAG: 3-hydroxyacyl-ACP dehydratase FabZ family protein [Planctomycetaceae bacterium]
MRWFWVDRFTEFESGLRAKAVKTVTLAEEHLHDHFPNFAIMPGSLIIEGLAQTGGILLGETEDFQRVVILAKIPNVTFHSWALPGDTLTYEAHLVDAREEGGSVECTAHVGDRLVADAEIVFVHLDKSSPELNAVDQKNFVFSMNLLGILDVGKAGDGSGPSD